MKLYKHQEDGVRFLSENMGGFLKWPCGTGKTIGILEYFHRLKSCGVVDAMLVICPPTLIDNAWGDDLEHYPQYTMASLRKKGVDQKADIYAINFEMLVSSRKYMDKLKKTPHFKPNLTFWGFLSSRRWLMVIDESSRLKTHNSGTTRALSAIRPFAEIGVAMSATPAPNTEAEWWGQIEFIRPGLLGKFYAFRSKYFHVSKLSYFGSNTVKQYDITNAKRAELLNVLKPYIHTARELDLPDMVDIYRYCELPRENRKVYETMKREQIAFIQDQACTAENALARVMRLRQVTGGFMYTEEGNTVHMAKNPKITLLKDVIEEVGDAQAIIWCIFREDNRAIQSMLSTLNLTWATAYGETKDLTEQLTMFKDGSAQFLIASPQSIGHGVTLVNAKYNIHYSLDYSWERHHQSIKRIHRGGQKESTFNIYLLAKNTVDDLGCLPAIQKKEKRDQLVKNILTLCKEGV